jgi:hypothetical protein
MTSFIAALIVSLFPWKSELTTLFLTNLGKRIQKLIKLLNILNVNNAVSHTEVYDSFTTFQMGLKCLKINGELANFA